MARVRHLTNAPIREALIDLQFEQPPTQSDLATVATEFAAAAAATGDVKVSDIWEALFEIKAELPDGPQATNKGSGAVGKRVDLSALHQVVQFRKNGFAFSQLKPYDSWESTIAAARPIWSDFLGRLEVRELRRVAVRYINSVTLPLPFESFKQYLNAPPVVPPELPQALATFLSKLVMPIDQDVAIVTQGVEGETEVDGHRALKILLDIDVIHTGKVDLANEEGLLSTLERLRVAKNKIFFALLTDRTLEMFE